MTGKKLYIAIGVLTVIFVAVFLLFQFVQTQKTKSLTEVPQTSPTISYTQGTAQLSTFKYPLIYEDIKIDFFPVKKQMIVYYQKDRTQAADTFNKFLSQYKIQDFSSLYINVEYIGLTKDPNEPPAGYSQK